MAVGMAVAAVDLRHRRDIRSLFRVEAVVEIMMAVAGAWPNRASFAPRAADDG
jgi:hypothetical protein